MTEHERLIRDLAEAIVMSLQQVEHPEPQWQVTATGVRIATWVILGVRGTIKYRTFQNIVGGGILALSDWNPRPETAMDRDSDIYRNIFVPNWPELVAYVATIARAVLAGVEAPGCPVCGAPPPHLAV